MPSRTAFVTGANGHLGNNLVKALMARGWRVRASVRDASDPRKRERLPEHGLELVSLDVRDADAFARHCEGVDVLFHAAATYKNYVAGAAEAQAMLRDSLDGAAAAVRAAAQQRIPRLVLTSSVVTLPFMPPGGRATTEEDWRTDFRVPYHRAKTLAEQQAWKLAGELGVDMVAVLPGAILGPGFSRSTASTDVIEVIRRGGLKNGVPNANFPAVDIRDVVDGHLLAADTTAGGRFILCNDHLPSFMELATLVHQIDPSVPPPGRLLPDFLVPLAPMFDWLNHRLLGSPRTLDADFVAAVKGMRWTMSNRRAQEVLGWRQRIPLARSVADTLASLRALATRREAVGAI